MPELTLWKDQQMRKLRRDLDHMFNRMWTGFGVSRLPSDMIGMLSMDISETERDVTIKAEVPGIAPGDLQVVVTDDRLSIRGKRSRESVDEGRRARTRERSFGSFARSFRLPCKVRKEDVTATYQDGILRIVMPKCDPEKPREVEVEVI